MALITEIKKNVTLHDVSLDTGQGMQPGHLVADFYKTDDDRIGFESNVLFQPFGNNGQELKEIVLSPEALGSVIKQKFLDYAEECFQ
jgi:hypothetical protein